MNDFYRTRMGDTFFNGTLPRLIKQLEKLNENLERIAKALESNSRAAEITEAFSSDSAKT